MSRQWSCTCDPTRGDSCRVCDGTARDERDPNWRVPEPLEPYVSPGRRPLWTFIYPITDQGDVA